MKNEEIGNRAQQRLFFILNSQFLISKIAFALYLLALPIYCLLRLAGESEWQRILTFAIPCLLCLTGFIHAVEYQGWRRALFLFGSGALISLIAEALGSSTGVIFGNYSYTDQLGYKLFGLVPWLIPIAWCSMLYPAWHVAWGSVKPHAPRLISQALRITTAALAITAWDLSLDPRMVQDGYWVWHQGGPYFGIPISNYVGWFVTALVIFGVWSIVRINHLPLTIDHSHSSHSMVNGQWPMVNLPKLAYLIVWLGESMANVVFWAGPGVGLSVFVGMGVFALPVLVHLTKRRSFALKQHPA